MAVLASQTTNFNFKREASMQFRVGYQRAEAFARTCRQMDRAFARSETISPKVAHDWKERRGRRGRDRGCGGEGRRISELAWSREEAPAVAAVSYFQLALLSLPLPPLDDSVVLLLQRQHQQQHRCRSQVAATATALAGIHIPH